MSNVDLGGNFQACGGIGRKLAHGTPKCEELRCRYKVLFAVVDRHWHPSLAQHCCWRESDLSEPYPKGVRGFETVWYFYGHLLLSADFARKLTSPFGNFSIN